MGNPVSKGERGVDTVGQSGGPWQSMSSEVSSRMAMVGMLLVLLLVLVLVLLVRWRRDGGVTGAISGRTELEATCSGDHWSVTR